MARIYLFIIMISALFFESPALADTVYYKDGTEEKGIVVENYHDRLVINTINGEREIKKENIKDILFDRHEQNLVKLGDYHQQRGNLVRAYTYYKKAAALNPRYKEAQEKFIHLRSVLLKRPDKKLEDDIARRNVILKESGRVYAPGHEGALTLKERFYKATGLGLSYSEKMPRVEKVLRGSPAEEAGIKNGDYIVSIWGRLTGYLDIEDIEAMILDGPSPKVTLAIKRSINIPCKEKRYGGVNGMGFSLNIKDDGLFISSVKEGSLAGRKGLMQDDLLISINNKPTRYMQMKEALRLIGKTPSKGSLQLDIIRDLSLWQASA